MLFLTISRFFFLLLACSCIVRFTITWNFCQFSQRSKIGDDSNLLIIGFLFLFSFIHLDLSLFVASIWARTLTHWKLAKIIIILHRFSLIAKHFLRIFGKCETCFEFVWRKCTNYGTTKCCRKFASHCERMVSGEIFVDDKNDSHTHTQNPLLCTK